MSAGAARVVLVTAPDAEAAAALAHTVVGEGLAACANLLPTIRSIYRWEGAVQDEAESLVVFKTAAERVDALARRIVELHSYDVPEVVALPVDGGHAAYLAWVLAESSPSTETPAAPASRADGAAREPAE